MSNAQQSIECFNLINKLCSNFHHHSISPIFTSKETFGTVFLCGKGKGFATQKTKPTSFKIWYFLTNRVTSVPQEKLQQVWKSRSAWFGFTEGEKHIKTFINAHELQQHGLTLIDNAKQ